MANAPKKSAVPLKVSAAAPVEAAVATVNAVLPSEAKSARPSQPRRSNNTASAARWKRVWSSRARHSPKATKTVRG